MITGSKKDLLNLIKRKGRLSIDVSAAETSLAKTTLREHFSKLEKDGLIMRSFKRSGPGRPSLYFELTQKGNSIFPSYAPKLMREFIHYLRENEKEELVEDFFVNFWQKKLKEAQKFCEVAKAESTQQKLSILTEILEKEGFMPEVSGNVIRECNCPFAEIIKETRLPCQLEKQFISKILNREIERSSYLPDGDYSCSYQIQ